MDSYIKPNIITHNIIFTDDVATTNETVMGAKATMMPEVFYN